MANIRSINDNPIVLDTSGIEDGAVTADKLANGAVTSAKMANGAVNTSQLANSAVTRSKLYMGSVATEKLQDGSVTSPKLAGGAVTADKLGEGVVSELTERVLEEATDTIGEYVDTWLDEHPEATTTVEDKSITIEKISDGLREYVGGMITRLKYQTPIGMTLHGIAHVFGDLGSVGQSAVYVGDRLFIMGQGHDNEDSVVAEVSTTTGLVIESAVIPEIGHANGACAIDNLIYVANGKNVVVVDPDTLTLSKVVQVQSETGFSNVFSVDGTLHAVRYDNTVVAIDTEAATVEQVTSFTPISGSRQNACYHDGVLYQLYTQPNRLLEVDFATGETIAVRNIPRGDGTFPAPEAEGIFVKDGVLCISFGMSNNGGINYSQPITSLVPIFETDVISDTIQTAEVEPNIVRNIIVDGTVSPLFKPSPNSLDSLDIACAIVEYAGSGYIALRQYNETRESVRLVGAKCTIRGESGGRTVYGVFADESDLSLAAVSIASYLRATGSTVEIVSANVDGELFGMVSRFKVNGVNIRVTDITNFHRCFMEGSIGTFNKPTTFASSAPQAQTFIDLTTTCDANAIRISCLMGSSSQVAQNAAAKHTLLYHENIRYNLTHTLANSYLAGNDITMTTSSYAYPKIKFEVESGKTYLSTEDAPDTFSKEVQGQRCVVRVDIIASSGA